MTKPAVLVIESSPRYRSGSILHCSVHKDAAVAYGTAMLEMDQYMEDTKNKYHFSSIFRLDCDAGFGFEAINESNEDDVLMAMILDISNEDEITS